MQRDIHLSWVLKHDPAEVWACLTDPELMSQWLMKTDFKPIVGHQFKFWSKPIPRFNWDGVVYCEVLEVVPQQKLSFTWRGGPGDGTWSLDTTVTWTLAPHANGTELKLSQVGFRGFKNLISSFIMDKGWRKNIISRFEKILQQHASQHA